MRKLTLILGLSLASIAGAEDHASFVRQAFAAVDVDFKSIRFSDFKYVGG